MRSIRSITGRPSWYFNSMDRVLFALELSTSKPAMEPSAFRTLRMATFSFEAPMPTVGLPADCAFLIRVKRSAIGSVMLIVRASPTRLRQARNLAAVGGLTQLGAGQAKFAVHAARPAGNGTAIALPRGTRIARLLLQRHLRGIACFR